MSTTNTEQEQVNVETPTNISNETENATSTVENKKSATTQSSNETDQVEQTKSTSSWLNNFGLSSNLTSQLTNFSSSFLQVTSKVTAAANTLVQKTLPQRPSTPVEHEATENAEKQTEEDTSEQSGSILPNKDITKIFNDISSTVKKGAQQLKHAVEEKSLIGEFTKEHEKFLIEKRTKQRREEAAVPPWIGYVEEEEMKKQILALSKEKRNFLRNPPPGANYHFDISAVYPVAMATLEFDEDLQKMRFELVPKQISEESFWRNYFYRVSLIKQSTQLSVLTQENANNQTTDESSNRRNRKSSDTQEKLSDVHQEFVSEDYDTSAVNLDDIRREIEQLTETKNSNKTKTSNANTSDENEWDKAITDELDDVSAEELEAQINQMLANDLK